MTGSSVPVALDELESAVLRACGAEAVWPAQVAAGVFAGVDFAIARPALAREMMESLGDERGRITPHERLIGRLAGFIRVNAPVGSRLPPSTDEALVGGMVWLVGDHVRVGRFDRLQRLRPDLVLLVLLPYLGFDEARLWANRVADRGR